MTKKGNFKLYAIAFVLALLAAQVSITLHIADYGVLEHSHEDKECAFNKNCNSGTNTNELETKVYSLNYTASYEIILNNINSYQKSRCNLTRAPPVFISL